MLADFGDTLQESFMGGLINENCIVNFFLCLSLGPFLDVNSDILYALLSFERLL